MSKPFERGKSICNTARGRRLIGFERLESRELLSVSSGLEVEHSADIPAAVVDGNSRQMEALNRGVIAMRRATNEIYVGWRMLGTDPASVSFNLYRSANGGAAVKLNASPITNSTNYLDTTANTAVSNTYFVRPIIVGIELSASESFTLQASAPTRQYLNVPLQIPAGGTVPDHANPGQFLSYTYNANDTSVGDLDGDGQLEIVLKWDPSNSKDNSQSGYTGNVYFDAYKLDGTLLWRIDLGKNIRAGAHYSPFLVYDFDGDGKAEFALKTAPGTKDGLGNNVIMAGDDPNADYRNSSGYILAGPEYFTVFDGETGAELDTVNYVVPRHPTTQNPTGSQLNSVWGDNYGNRVDRFHATVAYLDGVHPSLVMTRGYYTRSTLTAWDFQNGQLTQRWVFDTDDGTPGLQGYEGQGNHSLAAGDVDGDGKDEIIYGSATINDDGTGLYTTGFGHGDAMHFSDLDPNNPGLEIFKSNADVAKPNAIDIHSAGTGQVLWSMESTASGGVGRAVAMDIDPRYAGYELWSTGTDGNLHKVNGEVIGALPTNMFYNFGVWWDADPLRELLDGTTVSDWNYTTLGRSNLLSSGNSGINNTSGLSSNNGSKSTPALSGDILGDWREEIVWRTSDNSALRIYSTTIPTTTRIHTLLHDPIYRLALSWQNSAYNQPPHPGFFLGDGMTTPPQPNIYTVSANPTIPGDFDLDGTVDGVDLGIWQQTYGMTQAQGYLPGDADGNGTVNGRDYLIWQRNYGLSQEELSASKATSSAQAALEAFSQMMHDEAIAQLAGVSLPAALAIDNLSTSATDSEVDLYFESSEASISLVISSNSTTSSGASATEDDETSTNVEFDFSLEVLESLWS